MPEIDETQLAQYQRMAALIDKASKNDKARALLQDAMAEVAPEEVGPEVRMRREMQSELSGIKSAMTEFLEAQKKRDEDAAAESAKAKLQRQWDEGRGWARNAGYTDEGLEKLEKFMEDEGIASHRYAAAAFDKANPPAAAPITGQHNFGWKDQPADSANAAAVKALWEGDENTFLDTMIPQALAEVRGR